MLKYFAIRREKLYHKIQYSKVSKHDVAAALLGVVFGAFVVHLSLNSLGSGSPDLSDLSILLWYVFLLYSIIRLFFENYKFKISIIKSVLLYVSSINSIVINLL